MKTSTKKCTGPCGEFKLLDMFGKNKNTKDNRQTYCKKCMSNYYAKNKERLAANSKEYRQNNSDAISLQRKGFRDKNKDRLNTVSREDRHNNKEATLELRAIYRSNNRESLRAYQRQYRLDNLEQESDRAKQWRVDNLDKCRKNRRQWVKNNLGKVKYQTAKRRAAKLQRTVSWANLDAIREIYKDCEEINLAAKTSGCTETFVVDHIIPLRASLASGLHVENNLQIITVKENLNKGNRFAPGVIR